MGHTCNLSAGKPETKGSQVQGQPRLHMAILSQEKKKDLRKRDFCTPRFTAAVFTISKR
jgi:hypothetical protein